MLSMNSRGVVPDKLMVLSQTIFGLLGWPGLRPPRRSPGFEPRVSFGLRGLSRLGLPDRFSATLQPILLLEPRRISRVRGVNHHLHRYPTGTELSFRALQRQQNQNHFREERV